MPRELIRIYSKPDVRSVVAALTFQDGAAGRLLSGTRHFAGRPPRQVHNVTYGRQFAGLPLTEVGGEAEPSRRQQLRRIKN